MYHFDISNTIQSTSTIFWGWRIIVDSEFSWTLFSKKVNSSGHFLRVNSHGHFCPREFLFLGEFLWTYFGLILVDTF